MKRGQECTRWMTDKHIAINNLVDENHLSESFCSNRTGDCDDEARTRSFVPFFQSENGGRQFLY